ncbi:MAG: type IV toxin-antitoxin system AbiEi family antitoxin domain-containing protein [Clostridia bacterium]|nr:type IV toxin-antitoxin system AbiEi family antitoxin domain-containing protein [Clostridia bacterium]
MDKYDIEKAISDTGILTVKEAMSYGISKDKIYREISKNEYERVSHGIYVKKDSWIDEMQLISLRYKDAVFSHDEALYYYDLTDREPLKKTITIYTGYNPSRLTKEGIKVYTVKKDLLKVGKTYVKDNTIPMYNLERTICDLVRSRKDFEKDVFVNALKRYVNRKDKDLNKLMEYGKLFKVDRIIREYMEVLI